MQSLPQSASGKRVKGRCHLCAQHHENWRKRDRRDRALVMRAAGEQSHTRRCTTQRRGNVVATRDTRKTPTEQYEVRQGNPARMSTSRILPTARWKILMTAITQARCTVTARACGRGFRVPRFETQSIRHAPVARRSCGATEIQDARIRRCRGVKSRGSGVGREKGRLEASALLVWLDEGCKHGDFATGRHSTRTVVFRKPQVQGCTPLRNTPLYQRRGELVRVHVEAISTPTGC